MYRGLNHVRGIVYVDPDMLVAIEAIAWSAIAGGGTPRLAHLEVVSAGEYYGRFQEFVAGKRARTLLIDLS